MISTQRLIILFIFINLLATSVKVLETNDIDTLLSPLDSVMGYNDEQQQEFVEHDESSGLANANLQEESTIGNALLISGIAWDIFKTAMNPFSISPSQSNNSAEKLLIYGLMLFRLFIGILSMVEFYNWIKNKKAT